MTEWKITDDREYAFDADLHEDGLPDVWMDVFVKWDGCVDVARYFNTPKGYTPRTEHDGPDSFHICDVEEFIEHLQKLVVVAREKFGEGWNRD